MEAIDHRWRKSSYSGNGAECVEVAARSPGAVAIRDSKNPDGPVLVVTRDGWADLTTHLQATL
jgi:hypothetical protein